MLGSAANLRAADDAAASSSHRPLFIYLVRPDFPDQTAMMAFLKRRLTADDFSLPLPGKGASYASDLPGHRLYPAGNLEGSKRQIERAKEKVPHGWIVFDLELPPPNVKVSPELEAAHKNFLKTVEDASVLTRQSGWKFMLTPVFPDIKKYAAQFAPFCDAVVLQVPHSLADYRGAVKSAVDQIRTANPKCLAFVQIGPRNRASGLQKINNDFEGLTHSWNAVRDLVDGILVYFFNEPDPLPGLAKFYDGANSGNGAAK
ncbi:MAG TPA: hypothetical protein VGH65_10140 [Verrucomicrobiaceae bacterium]